MTQLENGPVIALMYADESWFKYKSGVLDTCHYQPGSNSHAVLVVGHEEKNLIIKNSWGTKWGDAGFFKVMKEGATDCMNKIHFLIYPVV